jgi:SAM-dependent methyltransferase
MHAISPQESGSPIPFELELLVGAYRYQNWLVDLVKPYLGKRVLEVGSGIGNMSRHLPVSESLVLTEVNPALARILSERVPATGARRIEVIQPGESMAARFAKDDFDTVVSFNVFEQVEDDSALVHDLLKLLRASQSPHPKRLVSVVPAHHWAYGPVDKAFGHSRRYSTESFRKMMRRAGENDFSRPHFRYRYVNIAGLLGWWVNGKLLGRNCIGRHNMKLFEALCPVIRPAEELLRRSIHLPFGNSLLAVYKL